MITEKIVWGNQIFSDGTVMKQFVYECETSEEFIVLMNKLTNEEKSPTALIKEKIIKIQTFEPWLNMNSRHIKRTVDELTELTELVFDDGITDEMWDEVEKAINEINGSEE